MLSRRSGRAGACRRAAASPAPRPRPPNGPAPPTLAPRPAPAPSRVAPFTYAAAGKKLHVREANGHLLVRTGGGYEELLAALGKLPWGSCTPE